MGWKLKALAVLFGLMLIPLGGWPLSAILFFYAFSGLILRGLRRGRGRTRVVAQTHVGEGMQVAPPVSFKGGLGHLVRQITGIAFLGLSAVALAQRGTYSPLVFGGVGAILLLWGTSFIRFASLRSLHPVDESILLSLDPIHWFAMAEVKLATRQVGKALGGIDETLLITTANGGPSIFVVLKATSLTMRGAEETLLARFQELARISAPLGAYLLPVDSGKAADGLRRSVESIELDPRGWPSSLSTTDHDLLAVEARRGGFVHSVGAYKSSDRSDERRATLPIARQTLSRPSLLWEVVQELGKKVEWQKPDGYTTFLASMFATKRETIGERVTEAGSAGDSREVLVQSLGTPAVQMSRAQLRAIARIYA